MADFTKAVTYVFGWEGGQANNPADPGSLTKYGISSKTFPGVDMERLTQDDAALIYRKYYWLDCFDQIESQPVANKLLDMSVNFGQGTGGRIFQQAVASLVAGPVVVDGVVGPKTIDLANACDEAKLLSELKARAAKKHAELLAGDSKLAAFMLGWMRRDVCP